MKLQQDLREFIELLNSTKVKYVLVGGHAVAFHGYPRFTGDVDFFVDCSTENAQKLEEVLKQFGFASLGLRAKDFSEPGFVIQLGRPPNRIDLLTSIDEVDFSEAWRTRIMGEIDHTPVFILCKDLLIRNKTATGRPQDQLDVKKLSS